MRIYKGPGMDYKEIVEHYTDTIIYALNEDLLLNDLKKAGLTEPEFNRPIINHTRLIKNAKGEVMTLVRVKDDELTKIVATKNITILGPFSEIKLDINKRKIYDRVYDQSTKQYADPDTHEVYTHTPPEEFGSFGD